MLALLFTLAPGAGAREYIVNGRSTQASDAGPGTADRPFKTIGAAAERVQAGDTVTIRGGIYREAVSRRDLRGDAA